MTDPTKRDIESTLEDITDDDTSLDEIVLHETVVGTGWGDDLKDGETRTETEVFEL